MLLYNWASQVVLVVKHPPANAGDAGDAGLIPGSGRFHREGNGYLLQYFCLGNPMDKELHGLYSPWCHKESDKTE